MVEISTSLLNIEKENSTKTIYNLEVAKTDYFHIDVMDGKFVKNNTEEAMYEYTNIIYNVSNIPIDVHFMTEDVKEHIEKYLPFKPNIITFHIEVTKSEKEVFEFIKLIKENNCKVGISIKPDTKIEEIYPYLPYIHVVLIMTVEPGAGGQAFLPQTLLKVSKLKEYIQNNNLDIDIEVDGGINADTIKEVKSAGANLIVCGTYIVKSDNFSEKIKELKEI